ncbi:hypothetical protein ONE63_000282 [Megalurothrips usitatus]|uniref:Ig-like domain-containing protein n=1 Tax=Megalurothrips usitatus TaxID=439358 RepID=A0AAV7XXY9_9NEOP|nr:hypothetical protein ONE63_000282 [Megalurothrips usitatus]
MEHFRLLSTGSTVGELSFQWVGPRADEARYRDLLARPAGGAAASKWLDVNLLHQQVTLRVDPILRMLALSTTPIPPSSNGTSVVNTTMGVEAVAEGEPITLTCVATGSANIKFHWVKDGMVLGENTTRATKWLWTRVEALGGGRFQSELQVRAAVPLHAGRYTCKAADWEARACASLQVRVRGAPQVLVAPMASTLKAGDNLTVTCLAQGDEDGLGGATAAEPLGFTWTRNRALLPLSPGKEVWEDLVPAGSLLRLYNVRRAATYCCQVRGRTLSRTACSDVHVVGRGRARVRSPGPGAHRAAVRGRGGAGAVVARHRRRRRGPPAVPAAVRRPGRGAELRPGGGGPGPLGRRRLLRLRVPAAGRRAGAAGGRHAGALQRERGGGAGLGP